MAKTTAVKSDKNELTRHAITAYGYPVRWGSRLTLPEFTAAIRRHSTDQRVETATTALESAMGFMARDWRGLRANRQC